MSAVSRQFLLGTFFSVLERSGVDYCVLAGYDNYPEEIASDVDFMIRGDDLAKLPSLFSDIGRLTGAGLVQILQHETTASYFVLAALDDDGVVYLHPDSSTDYRRSGRVWLRAAALLPRRRRHARGFFVPSAEDAFIYYLIKKLDKGGLSEIQAQQLSSRFRESPGECRRVLASLFSPVSARVIATAAENGLWTPVREQITRLRKELHKSVPVQSWRIRLRHDVGELLRRVARVRRPTGLCIAVLGADGAGKSTVIGRLTEDMAPAFRNTHYQHLRPNLWRRTKSVAPVTDPHRLPARGNIGSILKLAYFYLHYLIGYALEVRPMLVRSTLVVFDRYFHDLLVDPRRYRYGAPHWLARMVARAVPKPDLWLILDAPAEVLQARKPEVSFAESARQGSAYRQLAGNLERAVLIDASLPLEAVLHQARHAVLAHLALRTAARLGIEPVMPAQSSSTTTVTPVVGRTA